MSDKKTEDVITKEFDVITPETVAEEEEDIKIYEPKEKDDDRNTRILDFEQPKARREATAKPDPTLEGQLVFDGMEPEEEPEQEPEKTVEEQLQDARREKVENFRLIENDGLRLAGEEESGEAGAELPAEEEENVLEDYNSYAETAAVRSELVYRRRGARIGLLVGGFLEFLLLCLMLVAQSGATGEPFFFLGANLVLLIGIMLTAHRVIADGFGAIVRLRCVADTVTALGAFAAAIQTGTCAAFQVQISTASISASASISSTEP